MGISNLPNGVSSFGQIIYGNSPAPTLGKVYHVKKSTDANYGHWVELTGHTHYEGSSAIQPTITAAVAAADDFDTIWVYPGVWQEAATIDITQDSLKLLAADFGPGHAKKNTHLRQYGQVNTPVITVDGAHNVEIAGFRISPYDGGGTSINSGICVAETTWTHAIYIHDNYFYAYNAAAEGIELGTAGGAGTEATDAVIQNNYFQWGGSGSAAAAQIQMHDAPRCEILNNKFDVSGTHGLAIHYTNLATTHYKSSWICDNYFCNSDGHAGCTGIDSGSSEAGRLFMSGNQFVNFASEAKCITVMTVANTGLNYLYLDAMSTSA